MPRSKSRRKPKAAPRPGFLARFRAAAPPPMLAPPLAVLELEHGIAFRELHGVLVGATERPREPVCVAWFEAQDDGKPLRALRALCRIADDTGAALAFMLPGGREVEALRRAGFENPAAELTEDRAWCLVRPPAGGPLSPLHRLYIARRERADGERLGETWDEMQTARRGGGGLAEGAGGYARFSERQRRRLMG